MIGYSRGGALVETALTMGIVLLVLFATLQLSVLGFSQAAQDGAAFVAARTYAQNIAGGATNAKSIANLVFGTVPTGAIAIGRNGNTVTAGVTTPQSIVSIPGAPSTTTLRSSATEPLPAAPGATPGAFSVVATLSNYRDASGAAYAGRTIGIAQTFAVGHGHNGRFAEWGCRAGVYSGLSFPSHRPTGAGTGPNSVWDAAATSSPLYAIYRWDGGTTCD